MPAVIPIVAAVISATATSAVGAGATIAGSAIAAHGAGGARGATAHQFPIPKYERGLQSHYARLLAENELAVPPSFGQYVQSGGTAQFPIKDPGFTPKEARQLGMVGKRGQALPFVQPGQTELTPEQRLYLGFQRSQRPGASGALVRAYRLNERIGKIAGRPSTDQRDQRLENLRAKRDKLLSGGYSGGLA